MTDHKFTNYLYVKDNFLRSPDKVLELSYRQKYSKSEIYPGLRTESLFDIADDETKHFASYFAQRIKHDVFPGLTNFMLDIRFHINESFDDELANIGWIHSDPSDLAGLLYLTPLEQHFNTGTSIFIKKTDDEFETVDINSRLEFNSLNKISETYKTDLQNNWSNFDESIRVGNRYNRLVAYDAKSYHRPNSFKTAIDSPRRSLLFFIKGFSYIESFNNDRLQWRDE